MRRRRNSAPAPQPGAACRLQRHVRRRSGPVRRRAEGEGCTSTVSAVRAAHAFDRKPRGIRQRCQNVSGRDAWRKQCSALLDDLNVLAVEHRPVSAGLLPSSLAQCTELSLPICKQPLECSTAALVHRSLRLSRHRHTSTWTGGVLQFSPLNLRDVLASDSGVNRYRHRAVGELNVTACLANQGAVELKILFHCAGDAKGARSKRRNCNWLRRARSTHDTSAADRPVVGRTKSPRAEGAIRNSRRPHRSQQEPPNALCVSCAPERALHIMKCFTFHGAAHQFNLRDNFTHPLGGTS
jgi:hypothetical protein